MVGPAVVAQTLPSETAAQAVPRVTIARPSEAGVIPVVLALGQVRHGAQTVVYTIGVEDATPSLPTTRAGGRAFSVALAATDVVATAVGVDVDAT